MFLQYKHAALAPLMLALSLQPAGAGEIPQRAAQAVVHLRAEASTEAAPDTFTAAFSAVRSGHDVAALNAASQLEAKALAQARADGVEATTSGLSTQPSYANTEQGLRIDGWTVRARVQLKTGSAQKLSRAAADLGQMLQIDAMGAEISPEKRAKVQAALADEAVAAFRTKASRVAHAFGATGYTLVDATVQDGGTYQPRPLLMATRVANDAAPAIAVQPDKQLVRVEVSGSVRLRP